MASPKSSPPRYSDKSLIESVADAADLPLDVAADAVGAVLRALVRALAIDGRPVEITGFGSLVVRNLSQREVRLAGVNPRKGEIVRSDPSRRKIVFLMRYPGNWPRLNQRLDDAEKWFRAIEIHRRRRDHYCEPDPDLLP